MPPIPTIIGCGPDTDDVIALLLALASPELEIRAVYATNRGPPGPTGPASGRRQPTW